MENKGAERLNGTIDFFLKGQYGIIKGADGKEYFFGKKALTSKTKLVHDDIVQYVVDEKHPLLAVRVIPTVAQNRVRYALGKKNYSLLAEKNKLWNVSVKRGSQRITIIEHMTLPEVAEWVKTAKKLTTEDIDKMFMKNDMKSKVNIEKSNVKNDDCKIGGHIVPDDMAKNFGVPDDGTDTPVKKSLEEAAGEADIKVGTEVTHVHRQFA